MPAHALRPRSRCGCSIGAVRERARPSRDGEVVVAPAGDHDRRPSTTASSTASRPARSPPSSAACSRDPWSLDAPRHSATADHPTVRSPHERRRLRRRRAAARHEGPPVQQRVGVRARRPAPSTAARGCSRRPTSTPTTRPWRCARTWPSTRASTSTRSSVGTGSAAVLMDVIAQACAGRQGEVRGVRARLRRLPAGGPQRRCCVRRGAHRRPGHHRPPRVHPRPAGAAGPGRRRHPRRLHRQPRQPDGRAPDADRTCTTSWARCPRASP